jgi:hypothetical protein
VEAKQLSGLPSRADNFDEYTALQRRTGNSPFCHLARAKTSNLPVPTVIRHEIGIGKARNLTDDRDERDQMDEQSKDRDRDGEVESRPGRPSSTPSDQVRR